ncbi:hypothetical protein LO763_01555 [Glycomyces sp. A-F 0318]|uniref:hypothetical protein n=1 Tax=Glycomyces amatae TaxID=2881355 RepID=UPI001E34B78F|nr:hypothetical protein [Glycomyces amatae]MCD0442311.1 hypothetical protein [Glycomyces amatae]
MTRNLTLIKGFAALGAAGLLLAGCGGNELPAPGDGDDNGGSSEGGSSEVGSYSVMIDWDGCEAFDDIQTLQDFMGVTDLGGSGLVSSATGGGLDGEAFTCGASATLPSYNLNGKDIPGDASIDVGGVPWDSPEEAAENFEGRVEQLKEAIEIDGVEMLSPQEGEIEGDWDASHYFASTTSTGHQLNAIGLKGDLIVYVFITHFNDPGVFNDDEPVYPFTDEELVDWVLNEYMPQTHADLLAKKESGL